MSKELAPRLDPRAIEPARYKAWQDGGHFHVPASAVLEDGREPYVIVIPPPNVTAALHMGHGLNNTVQDVLIRWRRMQGRATLWVPGTDHAGIATQNVVERKLAGEGVTRQDLGRDAFVARVWDFVEKTGGTILERSNVDVGIAVAADGGLVVPVLRDSESAPLDALTTTWKDLVGRARKR
ncbi:MAG: class I tRNA ligase family protein, partial [Longimicrobiales bacterium]